MGEMEMWGDVAMRTKVEGLDTRGRPGGGVVHASLQDCFCLIEFPSWNLE